MAILIVDNSSGRRKELERLLRSAGHSELLTAPTLPELSAHLERADTPVDLVLMEIDLPDTGGLETCRLLSADERFRDIPVILIAERADEQELQLAFAAGAADYLGRPLFPAVLLARVEAALKLKRELDRGRARERELMEAQALLERANENLNRLANLDAVTGIANRRQFDASLDEEWRRAYREEQSLALILADADRFKSYNDTFGHPAGDACLKELAEALSRPLNRAGDLVARYGGEEFGIILPWTDAPGAVTVAEKLRDAVESLRIPLTTDREGPTLTISLGVAAAAPRAGGSPAELLAAADQALYRAKEAGRNRVAVDA